MAVHVFFSLQTLRIPKKSSIFAAELVSFEEYARIRVVDYRYHNTPAAGSGSLAVRRYLVAKRPFFPLPAYS